MSHLACENAGPEFFIQDYRALKNIDGDVRNGFCREFEDNNSLPSGTPVCSESGLFNFVEHSERVEQFITSMSATLEGQVSVPASFSELGQNPNHIRALMYLCTHYRINQAARLLSSDIELEEKTRILEMLAHNGLLGHYLATRTGRDLLTNSTIPLSFRTNAIKLFINSPNSSQDRIQYYLRFYQNNKDKDNSNSAKRELINVLRQAFSEYLELPPREQNSRTLSLMAEANIEGAPEAVAAYVANDTIRPVPESAVVIESAEPEAGVRVSPVSYDVPAITPHNSAPNCSEEQPLTASEQRQIIGPLNSYLVSRAGQENSTLPQARESIHTWSWYGEIFRNDSFWPEIELYLHSRSDDSGNLLKYGRRFYCFVTKTLGDYETLQEQRVAGSVSPELANQIFSSIHGVQGEEVFASMIARLAPYLSEENKLLAIAAIDRQVQIGTSDEIVARRNWRHDALLRIIQTHTGAADSPVILRAITALGNNGSLREEESLAQLFARSDNQNVRLHILRQYDDSLMINSAENRLNIFSAITNISNEGERNRYLTELYGALRQIDLGSGQQYRDRAADTTVVSPGTYASVIGQMRTIATDSGLRGDLDQEIARLRLASEGRDVSEPDSDSRPPIAGGDGGLKPSIGGQMGDGGTLTQDEIQRLNDGAPAPTGKPTLGFSRGLNNAINDTRDYDEPNRIGDAYMATGFGGGYNPYGQKPTGTKPALTQQEEEMDNSQSGFEAGEAGESRETPSTADTSAIQNGNVAPNNNFISTLGQAFNNNPKFPNGTNPIAQVPAVANTNTAPANLAGGSASKVSNAVANADTRSVGDRLREFENNNSNSDSPRERSPRRRNESDEELIREIRQITEDTSNLRERIDNLDIPTAPSNLNNPTNNGPAVNNNENTNNQIAAVGPGTTQAGRGPASVNTNSGRGPASVGGPVGSSGAGGATGDADNGLASAGLPNQSLLSPYTDPSQEDLSKVIVVRLDEEKNLLRNYMAAKENMTCPELRFVQDFYEKHIDNFILSKRRKPWREYALLELDGMNFRFNYPGAVKMRQEIKTTCSSLSGTQEPVIGQSERAPASAEEVELVPEEVMPAQEEQGIIKKFMLKLGL